MKRAQPLALIAMAALMLTLLLASPLGLQAAETQPHRYRPFLGTEGKPTTAMLAALNRMSEACLVKGQRHSLGHFRWSGTPLKLTHLGLWGSAVTNDIVALSAELPDLFNVSLYETNLDDAGVQALRQLPNLRLLAFTRIDRYEKPGEGAPQWSYPFMVPVADRPRVTGVGLRALTAIKTLEILDLCDATLTANDLAVLASWPKLTAVSLPTVVDDVVVGHLKTCPKLNSLTLGNRAISAAEIRSLAAWTGLRTLTLVHAQLSDETLQALSLLPSVQTVELTDCGLTDEQLQHLRGSPKLTHLILDRNEIAGPGLKHLVPLKLTMLRLQYNNVSDATLSELPQFTTLKELEIPYCRTITDQGIRSGILQGMRGLKKLNLRGLRQVTDASLDDLLKFGHLTNLNIRETTTSPQAVEKMKSAMPKTEVFK